MHTALTMVILFLLPNISFSPPPCPPDCSNVIKTTSHEKEKKKKKGYLYGEMLQFASFNQNDGFLKDAIVFKQENLSLTNLNIVTCIAAAY